MSGIYSGGVDIVIVDFPTRSSSSNDKARNCIEGKAVIQLGVGPEEIPIDYKIPESPVYLALATDATRRLMGVRYPDQCGKQIEKEVIYQPGE